MADRVVVRDLAALERFAGQLDRAKQSLEEVRGLLKSSVNEVSTHWQDPQRDKCAQEIEAMSRNISNFAGQAAQQVAYCRRLAAHLRSTPR